MKLYLNVSAKFIINHKSFANDLLKNGMKKIAVIFWYAHFLQAIKINLSEKVIKTMNLNFIRLLILCERIII